jgi:hypothetical protein
MTPADIERAEGPSLTQMQTFACMNCGTIYCNEPGLYYRMSTWTCADAGANCCTKETDNAN